KEHTTILDLVDDAHTFFLDYHRILDQNKILIEEIKEWYGQSGDYPTLSFHLLYDFLEVDMLPSVKVDYLDYFYKEKFHNTFSVFGETVTTYNENLTYLFRDIEKNMDKITHIIALRINSICLNSKRYYPIKVYHSGKKTP
ncbi:MAG TPA: hypothetical protein VJ878_00815, partial [Candidatus Izemoplasmatales bacterium]|nr:hypothetical protein [Candidatus Izemoplasmatales bacterium]